MARPGDAFSSVYADFVDSCGAARLDPTFAMVGVKSRFHSLRGRVLNVWNKRSELL
jgi:hypothetical protein